MSVWSKLGLISDRRVVAYCLVAGAQPAEVIPVGTIPAPALAHENSVRNLHRPQQGELVKSRLHDTDIVVLWRDNRTEAVCFRNRGEAVRFPGFELLTREQLAGRFTHFAPAEPQPSPPAEDGVVIRPARWANAAPRRQHRSRR